MGLPRERPWYAGGLAFECTRCGRCCAGPGEGFVWLSRDELVSAAEYLRADPEQFRARCVRLVGLRMSLREDPQTRDCIFLSFDGQGRSRCRIYPVRPTQCRTWPFWRGNLLSAEHWSLAGLRCPGINAGPLHDLDEIERERTRTAP